MTKAIQVPDFIHAKRSIHEQWDRMKDLPLFRVDAEPEFLWALYLASFPKGTNPMFRKRLEHDCSCCRSFIRNLGNVVALDDSGKLHSIWDGGCEQEPAYAAVFSKMAAFVKAQEIFGSFLINEVSVGTDKNFEAEVGGTAKAWSHFYVKIPKAVQMDGYKIPAVLGEQRATFDVFFRGLTELKLDAFDAVLDMIGQNSLYRGEEHLKAVKTFKDLKIGFDARADAGLAKAYAWFQSVKMSQAVCRIRNSAIGTLLIDLSEGVDLEDAVKKFEAVVAPSNYKRPTALVTKAMIAKARGAVAELGLTDALMRRHAVVDDLKIENVLFVDRNTRAEIIGDAFDLVPTKTTKPSVSKIESVPIDRFITEILPKAESVSVLLENEHASNMVSLIGPEHPTAANLFKWNNPFSWSYAGELADSEMRKAVKSRGGSVSGVFRFSHQWNYRERNASLMDLHVFMPSSNVQPDDCINDFYGLGRRVGWNQRNDTLSGGVQDVDYTNPAPAGYVPVENITFPALSKMPEGRYICKIHNWQLRAPTNGGFKAEIEFGGTVYEYEVVRPLKNKEWITVAEVTLKDGAFSIKHHLPVGGSPRAIWGLTSGAFHRVKAAMLSPNHWDGNIGNRHLFMMLEGCASDAPVRGFYNEFLRSDLDKHRKVLELVGSKAAIAPSDRQLSGLGFSSTQKASFTCQVKGGYNRTINVVIN